MPLSDMRTCAVCQNPIPTHGPLCCACSAKYGRKRSQWPPFVRVMVSSHQSEVDFERRHPHYSLESMLEKEQR